MNDPLFLVKFTGGPLDGQARSYAAPINEVRWENYAGQHVYRLAVDENDHPLFDGIAVLFDFETIQPRPKVEPSQP